MKELWLIFLVTLGAVLLVLAAVIVYIGWLHWRLHQLILSHRRPEVLRDAQGRPLKERV